MKVLRNISTQGVIIKYQYSSSDYIRSISTQELLTIVWRYDWPRILGSGVISHLAARWREPYNESSCVQSRKASSPSKKINCNVKACNSHIKNYINEMNLVHNSKCQSLCLYAKFVVD